LGERIKTLRQQKQLTLAELAQLSSLSASHLSQIEQDKKMPSLVALTSIADVLEINPRYLLEPEEEQVHVIRANHPATDTGTTAPLSSTELTSAISGSDLEVHRLLLQPDVAPLNFEPHPGEVFGFVLSGTLLVAIEAQQIELETGDSIHYDANQFYSLSCLGEKPCLVIWCSSPRWTGFEATLLAVTGLTTELPAD
jgi:transcriptional regulator with XRE-family HTH domain